ncbi:MAG: FKBP-type peptidyl-prolyl cis-trans isomerase [Bacteroidota bacterium]
MHLNIFRFFHPFFLLLFTFPFVQAQSKKELKVQVATLEQQIADTEKTLKSLKDSLAKENTDFSIAMHQVSYALAMNIAMNIEQQGFIDSLHVPTFQRAFHDVKNGTKKMDAMEAGAMIKTFITEITEKRSAVLKADGELFLKENAEKEGVTTLPSGLQYEIITAGNGEKPTANSQVKVHYQGMLTDGTIFDSSYERGEPIILSVQGVIAGWTEALQLMNVGSKWKLAIPYNLAYGERGAGNDIPPYATLVFDVELISIEN